MMVVTLPSAAKSPPTGVLTDETKKDARIRSAPTIYDLPGNVLGRIMDFIPLWNNGGQPIMSLAKTCCHFQERFTWQVALKHCFLPYEAPLDTVSNLSRVSVMDFLPVRKYLWDLSELDAVEFLYLNSSGHRKNKSNILDRHVQSMDTNDPLYKRWFDKEDLGGIEKLSMMLYRLHKQIQHPNQAWDVLKKRQLHPGIFFWVLLFCIHCDNNDFLFREIHHPSMF
jgi:hypothetical protein